MLPRRVIVDHTLDVMECLLLRNIGESEANAVQMVANLGKYLPMVVHRRDEARREKNLLSAQFAKASPEEREQLREKSKALDISIRVDEIDFNTKDSQIREYEAMIPNIPDPEIPLPSYLSAEQVAWKRTILRRVHRLIAEENA